MTCIGSHTVLPPRLKFGTEAPLHPNIAEPNFQPHTTTPGVGALKWGHGVCTAQTGPFCENFIKIEGHPLKWVRSDKVPDLSQVCGYRSKCKGACAAMVKHLG